MRKALFVISVTVLLFIINSLARSIYDLWQKQDLLTQAQRELENEKLENQKFKAGLSYVETREFIESEARNKLFLAKPGEQQVVIPLSTPVKQASSASAEASAPNWKKWLDLFF